MLGHSSRALSRSSLAHFLSCRGHRARSASTRRRSPTSTRRCAAAADLPRARAGVSRSHRRVRQAGSGDQRDHRGQPRRAGDRRFARSPIRGDATARRSAALRADDREGQFSDDRTADGGGESSRSRATRRRRTRFRCKRIKEAGAIVLAKSNMAEFAFSPIETVNSVLPGLHEESVRARSRDGGIVRRNGGRGRGGSRRSRTRHRHRQLDSRTELAPGARRHSLDDGSDEPRGHRAAESVRRHRRPDGAHRRRRRRGLSGRRRLRSRRSGDRADERKASCPTTRRRSCATDSRARASACFARRSRGRRVDPEVRAVFAKAIDDLRSAGATVLDTVLDRRSSIRFAGRTAAAVQSVQVRVQRWLAEQGPSVPVKIARLDRANRAIPSVDSGSSRRPRLRSSSRRIRCPDARHGSAFATDFATR